MGFFTDSYDLNVISTAMVFAAESFPTSVRTTGHGLSAELGKVPESASVP
jgi:hypothetical protein